MNARATLIAFVIAVASVSQAVAQDTESVQLTREMLTLLQVEEAITESFEITSPVVAYSARLEQGLSEQETARFGELLRDEFRNHTPEMINRLADVYAGHFSDEELREVLAFLRSPPGQALVRGLRQSEADQRLVVQTYSLGAMRLATDRLDRERAQR
ncbi:MAG: DUF2059 domain-containing protein [Hyphomonadaceae bacterium]